MIKNGLKWLVIACLLISYINRGLFVAMPETELNSFQVAGNECEEGEINSVIEFILGLVSEKHRNTVDEDGNSQESYGIFKVVQPFFVIHFTSIPEFKQQDSSPDRNLFFIENERILTSTVYGQIDHPPQA